MLKSYIHKDPKQIEELGSTWLNLSKESENITVFQNYFWIKTWWKEKQNETKPYIVEVRKNGKTVCILPLCVSIKRKGPLSVRVLKWMGFHSSDYLVPIITENVNKFEIIEEAFSCISKDKYSWDIITFSDVPEGSILDIFIKDKNKTGLLAYLFPYKTTCPYLPFEPEWKQVEEKIRPSFLKKIMKNNRRLAKLGDLQFKIVDTKEQINPIMNELFDLHCKRWRMTNTPSQFRDQSRCKHYLDLANALWEAGLLHLCYLSLDNHIISVHFGMSDGTKIYSHTPAYDPEYHKYSPSSQLSFYKIKDGHSRGYQAFDFMRGSGKYKKDWGTVDAFNIMWILFSKSPKSILLNIIYTRFNDKLLKYIGG